MGFNLTKKFHVHETRKAAEPFSPLGLVFEIKHISDPVYQEAAAKAGHDLREKMHAASVKGLVEGEMRTRGTRRRKRDAALADAAAAAASRHLDLEGIDLEKSVDLTVAAHLIANIDGLEDESGAAVEYTHEVGVELLSDRSPLGYDYSEGGEDDEDEDEFFIGEDTAIGDALALWVVREAGQHERFRESWEEAAGKNS